LQYALSRVQKESPYKIKEKKLIEGIIEHLDYFIPVYIDDYRMWRRWWIEFGERRDRDVVFNFSSTVSMKFSTQNIANLL
jgi:hypothetical protein